MGANYLKLFTVSAEGIQTTIFRIGEQSQSAKVSNKYSDHPRIFYCHLYDFNHVLKEKMKPDAFTYTYIHYHSRDDIKRSEFNIAKWS